MPPSIAELRRHAETLAPAAPPNGRRDAAGIWASEAVDYARMSEQVRDRFAHHLDLRHGPAPRHIIDVYLPSEAAAGPAPVFVFFHGGALQEGHPRDYAFIGEPYLARGAIVVCAGYRLISDELLAARRAVEREIGTPVHSVTGDASAEVRDIRQRMAEVGADAARDGRSAIAWVHDNIAAFGGDPARITIAGHSAGAMICVAAACDSGWQNDLGIPVDAVSAMVPVGGRYGLWQAGALISGADIADPPHEWHLTAAPRSIIVFGEEEYDGIGEEDPVRARHVAEINRTLIEALHERGADVTELALSPRGHWQTLRSLADESDRTVPAVLSAMGLPLDR